MLSLDEAMEVRVVVVYHSRFGHTQRQVEAGSRKANSVPGAKAELWATQQAIEDLDNLDTADAIAFGCPTSHYSAGLFSTSCGDGKPRIEWFGTYGGRIMQAHRLCAVGLNGQYVGRDEAIPGSWSRKVVYAILA